MAIYLKKSMRGYLYLKGRDLFSAKSIISNNEVLVAVGSNLGDRSRYISEAIKKIEERCGKVIKRAPLYETKPIGNCDQLFLNTAIICLTHLNPLEFLDEILYIETQLGRKRERHWDNRTIDLDIIMWKPFREDSIVMDTPRLKIPHPLAFERDFVLLPSNHIAPDWNHPVAKTTIGEQTKKLMTLKDLQDIKQVVQNLPT